MVGMLIFNGDRPGIVPDDGTLYGGLHCGGCFRYYDSGWIDIRNDKSISQKASYKWALLTF